MQAIMRTDGSHVCSDDFFKAEALRCREDRIKELEALKKKRQQEATTEAKALAVLDAKARCFEENDYRGISVQDLTTLLAWYNIPKEKMKKSDMVTRWKDIRNNHVPPPTFERWMPQDELGLEQLKTVEIDMAKTALGRYTALMKRNTVASVLDFTDKEWESLKLLKEADAVERNEVAVVNGIDDNTGASGMENEMIDGESGAL